MTLVYFSPSAEKDLKHLPRAVKDTLRDIHIPRLAENVHVGKLLHGPLRGYFSFDFWLQGVSYRIAYEIMKGNIIIYSYD